VPGTATVYVGSSEASDTDTGTPGVGVSATRYYTVGGATVATLHVENGVQSWSLMLGDTQGSAQVMVDLVVSATASGFAPITSASTGVTRTAYMPYGSGRGASQLSIDRGWLGQVQDDDTGLVYLNARYYDPVLGRFLSPDPLRDLANPATFDPFAYSGNNPVLFLDPLGTNWFSDHWVGIAVAVAVVVVVVVTAGVAAPALAAGAAAVASAGATMAAGEVVVVGASLTTTLVTSAGVAATAGVTADVLANTPGSASEKAKAAYPVAIDGLMITGGAAALSSGAVDWARSRTSTADPEPPAVKPRVGQAVKNWAAGIRTANPGADTVVIGRQMSTWVEPMAGLYKAGYYKGTPSGLRNMLSKAPPLQDAVDLALNKAWIRAQIVAGKRVIDVGQRDVNARLPWSAFYEAEQCATRNYSGSVRYK
jgi:RHS repeat-associated protein